MNCIVSSREKNKIYVITLVSRDKRQIVGYDIAFDRSRERIQRLVDNSPKASKYYSDAYPVYSEIYHESLYISLENKNQTYTVEDVNSDLRHYIHALRRINKCFFRSIKTMKTVFKLFVHAFNQFAPAKFNFPPLKSSFSLIHYI